MAMSKKHMAEIGEKTQFATENQPTNEAKSEGMKAWWDEKKLYEKARGDIYSLMLKKMGQTADGESALHDKVAENLIELIEPMTPEQLSGIPLERQQIIVKDRMDMFLKYFKELQPAKPNETTHKGDADNPLNPPTTGVLVAPADVTPAQWREQQEEENENVQEPDFNDGEEK